MRDALIDFFKNLLLRLNFFVSRTTNKEKLKFFFNKIRPVTSNHKLIRMGGDEDGGYLVPDDLNGMQTCFSPGVNFAAHFENELAGRGIKSYLADFSVEKAPITNEFFSFEKIFIGFENQPNFINLEHWIQKNAIAGDNEMILQMDIEGGEYSVLIETPSEVLKRFRIIIVEFHNLESLFDPIGFELISSCFYKLLKDFEIVHIHPNNFYKNVAHKGFEIPPLLEFTFIRKDRISHKSFSSSFPHELDKKNVLNKPDIILPGCFYR